MAPVNIKYSVYLTYSLNDSKQGLCVEGIKTDVCDAVLLALKELSAQWETETNYYKGMVTFICDKQGQLPES